MKSFPRELLIAFGMADMDFSSVLGFYGLAFVFIQVCLAIQAANYGVGLVSIEETEWTADFLLSKPVSRAKIMTSKLLAALTSMAVTQGIVWAASFAFINLFRGEYEFKAQTLLILLLSNIVFQLFFLDGRNGDFPRDETCAQRFAYFHGFGFWLIYPECLRRDDW